MSNFTKNWEAPEKKSSGPSGPLKPHIEQARNLISAQNQRLDFARSRLSEKDRLLFSKIVEAQTNHDTQRARMIAGELAEVRKVETRVLQVKLALEAISERLQTVKDYGDFLNTVTPALSIVKQVQGPALNIVPEAERGFSSLGESLSSIVTEAGGSSSGLNVSFETANEDAVNILNEAATVAGQKIKEKFPDLPADVSQREGIQL
jgi:division protein CdvB (Snf7/Vps24/ESCRT-III family)